jgi:cytochrome P450
VYRKLRLEEPGYHNPERNFWAVSRYDDVQRAVRNWQAFSNAQGVDFDLEPQFFGPGDFQESDPPKHERLRDIFKVPFAQKSMQQLEAAVRNQVNALLNPLIARGSGDFVEEVAAQLPLGIIFGLLGYTDDGAYLSPLMYDVLARVPGSPEMPERARLALRRLKEYAEAAASERRRTPKGDLMTLVVQAEAAGDVLPQEISGMCVLLLLAGWMTTSMLVSNAMWLLAAHPEQRALLARDSTLIPAAVEEVLRFDAPVMHSLRVLSHPVELHGETVPASANVILIWASANRDETRWPNGDDFDVSRELRRNLAFGDGIHHCLGAPLARLEGRILIESVLERSANFEVGEPERYPGATLRGMSRLPITF